MQSNVLLLESVALNLYEVNGSPDIPVVEVLTIILFNVFETSVATFGVPGRTPVVTEVAELVGPLPFEFESVNVTLYEVPCVRPDNIAL